MPYIPLIPSSEAAVADAIGLTSNFRNGAPRSFRFSKDGLRLFFLRSASGRERQLDLWYREGSSGKEVIVWSAGKPPKSTSASSPLDAANRDHQARVREFGTGIVDFDIDSAGARCAFSLDGRLHLLDIREEIRALRVTKQDEVSSVRISPDGSHLSYLSNEQLFVSQIVGRQALRGVLVSPEKSSDTSWGKPDFIGAEEMGRTDGQWWSPDSKYLIFQGVDNRQVAKWNLCDPCSPATAARMIAYPQAGTSNASLDLRLWQVSGDQQQISWDKDQISLPRWNHLEFEQSRSRGSISEPT